MRTSLIVPKKMAHKETALKHCRHCNFRINTDETECTNCRRNQSYNKEAFALILMAFVIALTMWLVIIQPTFEYSLQTTPRAPLITPPTTVTNQQTPSNFHPPATPHLQSSSTSKPASLNPAAKGLQPQSTSRYQGSQFREQAEHTYPFYVAEKKWNPKKKRYDFYRVGTTGTERTAKYGMRRSFISENQSDYPVAESGCGPTALLNLYIWYSKFGLIQESIRHSDPTRYKQLKFNQIDHEIAKLKGYSRSPEGGTNTLEQVMAIDKLLQENSRTPLRMHFEYAEPPLNNQHFLRLNHNYRAGILTVRPKDRRTGRLRGHHAVLVIRGDTDGIVTIANWGEFSRGRLIQKSDGQWFIPQDPEHHELRITKLTTLIPFTPNA
jgi:predicted nucleic acid-binding Zn ribbon protein